MSKHLTPVRLLRPDQPLNAGELTAYDHAKAMDRVKSGLAEFTRAEDQAAFDLQKRVEELRTEHDASDRARSDAFDAKEKATEHHGTAVDRAAELATKAKKLKGDEGRQARDHAKNAGEAVGGFEKAKRIASQAHAAATKEHTAHTKRFGAAAEEAKNARIAAGWEKAAPKSEED